MEEHEISSIILDNCIYIHRSTKPKAGNGVGEIKIVPSVNHVVVEANY